MIYYVIKNKSTNEILKNANGLIVKQHTIQECFEYLWYVLNLDDISCYDFEMKIA